MRQDFVIRADGRILTGKVTQTRRMKRVLRASLYTGKVDTTSTASKYVIFVEMEYPIQGHPRQISITPPIENDMDVTNANIGFVVYHKMIPVNDIRYLGREEKVFLDWSDPWYSRFDNRNIRRHHNSSVMSFLYVDPYEVRHEILARVKDLEYWLDIEYGLDDKIEIEDQEELKTRIVDFLIERNTVTIDNEIITPIIDKVHFVEVALAGIQILEKPKQMDYASAIIGVIFAYPNPGLPQKVTITWDMFGEKIRQVPNTATDPAGPMKYFLTPDDNVLVWHNYLKRYKLPTISEVQITNANVNIPFVTLFIVLPMMIIAVRKRKELLGWIKDHWMLFGVVILLGVLAIPLQYRIDIPFIKKQSFSQPESRKLLSQLLKNTYRAFDFREESDIYDKLAISNDGELLSEVYLQTKKSMVIENQGGIRAKVKKVQVLQAEATATDREGLSYNCKWEVQGTVGHWGHIHRRINQYHAIVNVVPVDGVWKMTALDIIEEVRL
jgi:hypothetical protein